MRTYVFPAIAVGAVVALAAFGGWSLRNKDRSSVTYPDGKTAPVAGSDAPKTAVDAAWLTWEAYVRAARDHDVAAAKDLAYKPSDACADPKRSEECFALMDAFYGSVKDYKKEDFKHAWGDAKQLVLSTDFRAIDDPESRGQVVTILYFAAREDGRLRPLRLEPSLGIHMKKTASSTDETIDAKLLEMLIDTDKDGKHDDIETCFVSKTPDACAKTDPFHRDTDGDGWWDGVEQYL